MLLKGPIILLVVGLTAVGTGLLTKSWRWLAALKPAYGVPWALLLILPWFLAIALKTHGAFFGEAVGHDMLGKVASGQEKHWGPPGFYLIAFWVTFWPAAPMVLFAAPSVWRERFDPKVLFLLSWVVPAWLIFELVPTEAAALRAAALSGVGHPGGARPGARRGRTGGTVVDPRRGVVVGGDRRAVTGAGAGRTAAVPQGRRVLGVAVHVRRRLPRLQGGGDAAGGRAGARFPGVDPGGIRGLCGGAAGADPGDAHLFPPPPRWRRRPRPAGCPDPQIASASYREPSLVFLGGTDVFLTDAAGAARFLREGECRVAIVDQRHQRAFALEAEAIGLRYRLLTMIKAANYNGGRKLNLELFLNVP